jgi:hypothetical protein
MSRKDRRTAAAAAGAPPATLPLATTRNDHARDLARVVVAPLRATVVAKPAPTLGHFVRHTYRNGELVSE